MIKVITLYNDFFSSLWVDLKIVFELRNKGRILKISLTQTTQTSKDNFNFDGESRELDLRTEITVSYQKQAIESNAKTLWPLINPESSEPTNLLKSRKTQQSAVILELCLDSWQHSKPPFSNSSGLKNASKELHFRAGLVWTAGLTVETEYSCVFKFL